MTANGAPNPYVLRLEKLEALVVSQANRIEALERVVAGIGAVFGGGGAEIADDDELDSKFGNEPVKKDPTDRFWKGARFVGKRLSDCPPEYLDALAKYKDVCARLKDKDGTEDKKKYAAYDRADAARARGWARRLRAGWQPPPTPERPRFNGTENGTGFGGGSSFGNGGTSFGGGSGFGASAPTPSDSDASPAPPVPPAEDDSFDFGANVERPTSTTEPIAEDDDPPL